MLIIIIEMYMSYGWGSIGCDLESFFSWFSSVTARKAYNIHKRKQKHTKLETQQQIQTKHQISRHEFDEADDDEEDF